MHWFIGLLLSLFCGIPEVVPTAILLHTKVYSIRRKAISNLSALNQIACLFYELSKNIIASFGFRYFALQVFFIPFVKMGNQSLF